MYGHPADPMKVYLDLVADSPTTHPNQLLLNISAEGRTTVVTIPMLARLFNILLEARYLDHRLYSNHRLRRGDATTAYQGSSDQIHIKRHGLWASNVFWLYVTAPSVVASQVAAALTAAMD